MPARLLAAMVVVGLALALRLYGLDREPVWLDEASSLHFSRFTFLELATEAHDTHPPLYYMIQRLAAPLGDSAIALRLPAMAFGTLAVLFTFGLGRQMAGTAAGILAAALLAVSSTAVATSQDARQYSLLACAAVLAAWAAVRILRAYGQGAQAAWRDCAGYGLATVVALYSHSIAVFLAATTGIYGFSLLVKSRSWRSLRQWILVHLAIGLAWSWWLPVVLRQGQSGLKQMAWLLLPTFDQTTQWLAALYGAAGISRYAVPIAAVFVAATLFVLIRDRREPIAVGYLAALAFGIPVLALLVTFAGYPVFMPRTIAWLAPIFFVLVATAFARSWRWAPALVVLLVGARGLSNDMQLPHNEDWRAMAPKLAAAVRPGDVLWTSDVLNEAALQYYWRGEAAARDTRLVHRAPPGEAGARVWVVVRDFDRHGVLESVADSLRNHVEVVRLKSRGITSVLFQQLPAQLSPARR